MRIRCGSIDEFIENLRQAKVYRGVVHYEREREPLNGDKHGATSFGVSYRASCVLEFEDGGQALLETIENCGTDRHTADGNEEGSERQRELHARILAECVERDLRPLPGIVDLT